MRVKELLRGAEREIISFNGCEDVEISGVTGSSDKVREGFAFLCITGTKFDGHTFIKDAKEKGAVVAIVEKIPECRMLPYVLVKSSRRAAAYIFSNANGNPEKVLKIVGVTGTNGKTSSVFMLSHIFENAGYKCGVLGTIINKWGDKAYEASMTTPDPENLYSILAMMKKDGVEYVFMEVSSHSLALGRVAPITFEAAIYTNLTQEHLDFHRTMEEYALAKEMLFSSSKLGIFNIDNAYVKKAAEKKLCRSVTYSLSDKGADYCAANIIYDSMEGVRYDIYNGANKTASIDTSIPGVISVYNTMGAALCAILLGIDVKTVERGIYELSGVPGRMERATPRGCPFTAIIDYAHTPDALENVLNIIKGAKRDSQRLTVLFGCGGDRDKTKRPVMGEIATRIADFSIITSDNCRTEDPEAIIADILAGVHKDSVYKVIVDRREAIAFAIKNAVPGEIILIAGKGHENYEITKEGKRPFSEKDEVNKALAARHLNLK